jgi:hypothetical protein
MEIADECPAGGGDQRTEIDGDRHVMCTGGPHDHMVDRHPLGDRAGEHIHRRMVHGEAVPVVVSALDDQHGVCRAQLVQAAAHAGDIGACEDGRIHQVTRRIRGEVTAVDDQAIVPQRGRVRREAPRGRSPGGVGGHRLVHRGLASDHGTQLPLPSDSIVCRSIAAAVSTAGVWTYSRSACAMGPAASARRPGPKTTTGVAAK